MSVTLSFSIQIALQVNIKSESFHCYIFEKQPTFGISDGCCLIELRPQASIFYTTMTEKGGACKTTG